MLGNHSSHHHHEKKNRIQETPGKERKRGEGTMNYDPNTNRSNAVERLEKIQGVGGNDKEQRERRSNVKPQRLRLYKYTTITMEHKR